jgi:hypothetical protein
MTYISTARDILTGDQPWQARPSSESMTHQFQEEAFRGSADF